MLGSAAFAGSHGGSRASSDSDSATLIQHLNSAAAEGDRERVRGLLTQLLQCRTQPAKEPLAAQVAALEQLFYAMRTMATTDELTGVYNRRGFEWVANRLLRHLARDRRGAVLLYVDVDNLKSVNDTLGHAIGDRLLTATASMLRAACGESAIIGRIGGDEFAVLVRHSGAEDHNLLRKHLKSLIAECNAAGRIPPLSMSIGVAEFDPLRPTSVLTLMERADRAMYVDKTRKVPAETAPPRLALAASAG
ncbi:MAG TPA: GGDEF domain-containing protein [Steroidobacteraceae bacterium]|jgi:diguanylate cyclase (GGDEF)-like protein|nr:GGDEF domain-containing protein [Steroidobacteraceae bacterium]